MAERDDVAGDAPAGRPDDRLIGVGHDDRVPAAEPDAGAAVPGEFHAPDSDTARLHGGSRDPRGPRPDRERPEAPAQSAPPVGGREDGTLWVRPSIRYEPARVQGSRRQPVKKATRPRAPSEPRWSVAGRTDRASGDTAARATIRAMLEPLATARLAVLVVAVGDAARRLRRAPPRVPSPTPAPVTAAPTAAPSRGPSSAPSWHPGASADADADLRRASRARSTRSAASRRPRRSAATAIDEATLAKMLARAVRRRQPARDRGRQRAAVQGARPAARRTRTSTP